MKGSRTFLERKSEQRPILQWRKFDKLEHLNIQFDLKYLYLFLDSLFNNFNVAFSII